MPRNLGGALNCCEIYDTPKHGDSNTSFNSRHQREGPVLECIYNHMLQVIYDVVINNSHYFYTFVILTKMYANRQPLSCALWYRFEELVYTDRIDL